MRTQFRQGDVLLVEVGAVPLGARTVSRKRGRAVLARGEVTGHAHALPAGPDVRFLGRGDGADPLAVGYLALKKLARLVHDEHAPVDLPPGNYRVVQQRRFAPRGAWRLVGD